MASRKQPHQPAKATGAGKRLSQGKVPSEAGGKRGVRGRHEEESSRKNAGRPAASTQAGGEKGTETGTGAPPARSSDTDTAARAQAQHFGALVRERREALKLRQDDLALATGVGRRFILELEAGKPSCQLGRALIVAAAVGLRPFDLMSANSDDDNALLPDPSDDDIEDAGRG